MINDYPQRIYFDRKGIGDTPYDFENQESDHDVCYIRRDIYNKDVRIAEHRGYLQGLEHLNRILEEMKVILKEVVNGDE